MVLGNNFKTSRNRSPMQSSPQSPVLGQDDQIRLVTALGLISSTTHWQEHGPPLEEYHQVKAAVNGNLSHCGKHAGCHLKPHAGRAKAHKSTAKKWKVLKMAKLLRQNQRRGNDERKNLKTKSHRKNNPTHGDLFCVMLAASCRLTEKECFEVYCSFFFTVASSQSNVF